MRRNLPAGMYKLLPGLRWLEDYNQSVLVRDLVAGITIAAMLIPQGMGYALLAGLPVEFGLYACVLPPIIYALLGTSNKLSIGPVALDSILILSGLSVLAEPGSEQYLELAVALTLMVGVIQALFGAMNFGFIANFLSYPVILGYTCAASLVIMVSQFESLLGVAVLTNDSGNVLLQSFNLIGAVDRWHWLTVAVAAGSILFLIYPQRWMPKLPCGLLLLIISMLLSGYWAAMVPGNRLVWLWSKGLARQA